MMEKSTFRILIALIGIGLIISCFAGYRRLMVEQKNKNVELTMDYNDIERLSAMDGITVAALLKEFKRAGINSIALPEEVLGSVEAQGKISIIPGYELSDSDIDNINPRYFYIISKDKNMMYRIYKELYLSLGKKQIRFVKGDDILEVRDDIDELLAVGVGVSPATAKFLAKEGFRVIPRINNNYRLNRVQINSKLDYLKDSVPAVDTIIFGGMQVLGYKYHIKETAHLLKAHKIKLGAIEFSKQKGDDLLVYLMNDSVTRVHSIGVEEMEEEMTKPLALARFKRSVVERGVNLLYIRPFYMMESNKTAIQTNLDYVKDLKNELIQAGYNIGPATHPKDIKINYWQIALLSMAACSAFIILLSYFIVVPNILTGILLVLAVIFSYLSLRLQMPYLWRGIVALSVACVFPTLSLIYSFSPITEEKKKNIVTISKIILKILGAFAITFVGILLIVGILADVQYMLGSRSFFGIKAALIIPPLLIAFYFFFLYPKTAGSRITFKQMIENTKSWFSIPITVGYVFIGVLILSAGAFYILRSGNFSMGVLGIESKLRGWLEWIFAVRPRTKEFFVGYPFLVFGSFYYLKGGRSWLWFFLAIGSIALISLTNTYCHVHSPLTLSTIRSFYGLILGIFVGLILLGIYQLIVILIKKKLS